MKLKIRGLVFVGFAAAVFAQSAMAERADDEKTVTSKWYVDGKFNGTQGQVITQGNGRGVTDYTNVGNEGSYVNVNSGTGGGDGVLVTGKAVKEALNGLNASLNIDGDDYTEKVASGYDSGYPGVAGHETGWNIVLDSTQIATQGSAVTAIASATGDDLTAARKKLATAGAVYDYAEATANKLPYNTDSSTETITLNSDNNTKFPTAQNVYEFVTKENKAWQPKVVSDDDDTPPSARTIYVGRYEPADDNTPASATWDELTTGTYVTNTSSTSGVYTIDIPTSMLADTATEIGTDGGAQGSLPTGLATAEGVRDYAVRSAWGSGNGGKTLVTTSDGNVTVSNVPAIPEPTGCDSANVHCALVTSYVNNAITLEWTVMAQ